MDLGKTVELLACILAHQKSTSDDGSVVAPMWQNTGNQKINLKRLKRDRVECVCGAVSDSYKVSGEDSDFTIDAGNSLDLSENCSKYLSVFSSKLSAAQLDFNKSYTQ
ncbi:hypothetical protein H0E87_030714, partial [Populus deltoides]